MPIASVQRGMTPHPNECPLYGTKLSDGEVSILDLWENVEYPFITITLWSTQTRNSNVKIILIISFRLFWFLQNLFFFSAWWLLYKDGMKPVVADKRPC